jgi:asparagine synthase (glutamine-hydrolysing)
MCGICGEYSPEGVEPKALRDMLSVLAHRGPDDQGIYVEGCVGLGNRRLSIIDLPGGHQPMSNEDGTIWVVYNGEIYNYKRLRHELEASGHIFRTRSDTEVIIHLYEEMSDRCVDRLNGMFAFAVWDENKGKLLLARDRLGQKPLFYAQDGTGFLFASEVKAILAVLRGPREMDYQSLHHYLSLRFIPPPHTMLRHIKKVPPAHILVHQHGKVVIRRYWDLSFRHKLDVSESDLLLGLGDKLTQAVDSHLVSDVPVGAFLSGGMDSSIIVAIMAGSAATPFSTFSVGVQEQDFNELPYARLVAERYGTCHVERCVDSELITLLPKIINHLDEPSDPIAMCMYYAAELAARHVKVVLGGDGGDELFAGFDRYLGFGYIDRYSMIPSLMRQKVIGPLIGVIPEVLAYKSVTQKLRWANRLSMVSSPGKRYAEATCFFRFGHGDKQMLFNPEIWKQLRETNSADVIATRFNSDQACDPIDRMLYADYTTRLPEHSLMLTDRMTMAHSLEARSPFLDHELVEYLAAFPSDLKIRGPQLKYVLRRLATDYLPQQIIRRRKQGFMFPIAYWLRDELCGFVKRYLLDSALVREGLFREVHVQKLVEDHRNSRIDNHVRLWMLLNVAIWHQIYIEKIEPESVAERMKAYL